MKKFVVEIDGKLAIIKAKGFMPKNAIGLAPQEAEHAEDLELVTETDEMGFERTIVKVSETKRQARLEREAAQLAEAEAKEAEKLAKKQERKDKAKAFDPQTAKLKDVAEMVQAIAVELGMIE